MEENNFHPLHSNTYTAGEDKGRLAAAARSLGLQSHRIPQQNVRQFETIGEDSEAFVLNTPSNNGTPTVTGNGIGNGNGSELMMSHGTLLPKSGFLGRVGLIFSDVTYMRASMHSTGIYFEDELDDDGRILIAPEQNETNRPSMDLEAFSNGSNGHPKRSNSDALSVEDAHGVSGGGSMFAAVFGIIKAMVGPAILYLPHGFATSGYAFATFAILVITLMFLYSSHRLLESWRHEMEKLDYDPIHFDSHTYGSILTNKSTNSQASKQQNHKQKKKKSKHVSYPELAYRVYGEVGEQAVKVGIALMQLGVCLTYFIFVPQNLHSSLRMLYNVEVPMWLCLFFMVLVEIPLSWIRDIRKLTFTNFAANVLIMYGLCTCLWLAAGVLTNLKEEEEEEDAVGIPHLEPIKDGWSFFIGTAVLLFEGSITLCIPLQEAIDTPKSRTDFPRIYKITIINIIAFYCFFAMSCWVAFGDSVKTALTTSLPSGVLATTVQLAYSLAVMLTFPLQAYPALEIICRSLEPTIRSFFPTDHNSSKHRTSLPTRNILTSCTVFLLSLIAIVEMKNLGHVVSLVGALLGCPIAFVFPPLIHNRLVMEGDSSKWSTGRVLNYVVAGLGVGGMIFATFTTLASWDSVVEG